MMRVTPLRHTVEAAVERFHAEGQGLVHVAGKQWLVHLDVATAGIRQRTDLEIERGRQVEGERPAVFIVGVGGRIHDGKRPGHGHLHRPVREGLGASEVVRQEMRARGTHLAKDRWQFRLVGAVAQHPARQVHEVESLQMPAVIVDVVLAPLLPVAGDVDARIDLVFHRLACRPREQFLDLGVIGL